ncbi:metallophosphoesterase [Pedobacter sp. Leaf132]|uniref:metallophosphoesterase n=1 Tax=Pedobacter sp. Leaf132 TaxID=2876557 RepID=UPI001E62AF22|nr:metallophosphoesterase [Pedobacter sp. Leaf132]
MNKIKIIHISDIHFEKNEPENQGLVISSFFTDLYNKIDTKDRENTYCIISGDLVNKGNSDQIFNDFYDNFIIKLTKVVPIRNIYASPGNHDLNRKIVQENFDEHNKIVSKEISETEFNNFIKTEENLIVKKFSYYANFCREKLHLPNFNLLGYYQNPIPEISIYFLNCSLFCYGGFNGIEDKGLLKIETSGLNSWIQENSGRTKILVMHHPLEHLSTFAKSEIKSMLINDIDILISGHIHEQELDHNYISENHGLIKLGSPQLFSDKTDLNGYSILSFEDGKIDSIEYRQWVKRQRKFMSGQEFSSSENGVRNFTKIETSTQDIILQKLHNKLQKSMKSYSITPNWVERTLKLNSPSSGKKKDLESLDYINLINRPKNYQIIAAPQFGLTCYAKYLSLKAWEIKKEKWLYLDANNWTYSKYHSDLDDALTDFGYELDSISCLLLDNWQNTLKESHKILENIKRKFPDSNIIIFSNFHDNIILEGLDSEESHEGFEQLYLCELKRHGIRSIVRNLNIDNQIGEENRVVDRLDVDLIDLNIHRTPINCLQILIAFLDNFEERPINRSKVFNHVLKVIFDNPGNLFYGNTLDEENCRFIIGFFCEHLLTNNKDYFTESQFHDICAPFCKENYNTTNTYDLLSVLKNNQILVQLNGNLRFRFSYWIYYFAALRMKISQSFSEYMFKKKHSLYFPEIIEFYTGIDGAREDVARMLIKDLDTLSKTVHAKVGVNEDYNPFEDIKWSLNETKIGVTQEQLIENVQNSKLPDEIKDVVADKNYNTVKPYSQTLNNFLEEYEVKNLMDLTKSASRALRNSEFISSKLKEDLIEKIFSGWQETMRVLFLIAPMLAKNGFGGVGGARFKLTEDFPKEYNECLKTVITSMPYNLNLWYKDDIFSDKLILLIRKYMLEFPDPNIQHIIALLECSTHPKGWKDSILNYIEQIDKNSFYLGDLCQNLINNYSSLFMNGSELRDTEYLIKACWAKHHTGSPKPGFDTVSKVSDNIIPTRNLKDLE